MTPNKRELELKLPEAEVSEEWRRETEVLTKRGSLETENRSTQLEIWKNKHPKTTGRSSFLLFIQISYPTDTPHITKVAIKKEPALLRFLLLVPLTIFLSYSDKLFELHQKFLGFGDLEREKEIGEIAIALR